MGGSIDTNYLEDRNTLLTLTPLYTFIQGIKEAAGDSRPHDFTLIEENDAKIQKLLKDNKIIENAESPVIIFGRLPAIRNWIYPTNTMALDTASFGGQWQRQASPRLWNITEKDAVAQRKVKAGLWNQLTFNWGAYIRSFIETFKEKSGFKTSSFGEGLGDYYNDIIKIADAANTDNALIFTHNIKNSNVLSLSFDSSPYKGELLNYSTESVYKVLDGVFPKDQLLSDNTYYSGGLGRLIDYVVNQVALDQSRAVTKKDNVARLLAIQQALSTKEAGEILLTLGGESGAENTLNDLKASTFFDSVIIKMTGPNNIIQKGPAGKNMENEAETLKKMNKYIINVDIKTLPFFNTTILPGKKCVLYGKPNLVKGASELRGKIETVPSFFTNAYTIIGYKHRISSTDAYSEFKLIQDSYSQGLMFKDLNFAEVFEKQIKEALQLVK
jgi:hypothetical protein